MAARRLAAACHSRMIKARGIGESDSCMARTAILICRNMRWCFSSGDEAIVAVHALLSIHFRAAVIEGATGKRRCCWRISCVAIDAITYCWHMVLRLPRCIHAIMTGSAGQSVVYSPGIQCRVVEACGKTAARLMAILTRV